MKLSELNFGIVEKDGEFNWLGLTAEDYQGKKVLTFLNDEKYYKEIENNKSITCIVTTDEVAQKIGKDKYGIIISQNPRKDFFELHNKLVKENFYFTKKENKISEKACISKKANIGEYNIKSTFMFWLDQTRENDNNNPNNSNKNNKGKYIKNIKFYSDYKKSQNLRAVIKFDENIYENQSVGNIQREWFAISKVIPSKEEGKLGVYYDLQNTGFNKTKKFVYSFDLVNNFSEKNKAEILYVNVYNKSGRKIESIVYKNYEFKNVTEKKSQKEHYELLVADVNLDEKLVINFK